MLDRPRHEKLIEDIRSAGARIRLITDGDLSAGISAAVRRTNVHAVMGIGGAPEGVLTAAALRCLNGDMQARLVPTKDGQEERMRAMGITDVKRIYTERDLAPGPNIMFAACGVTDGNLLRGVRFFGHGCRTQLGADVVGGAPDPVRRQRQARRRSRTWWSSSNFGVRWLATALGWAVGGAPAPPRPPQSASKLAHSTAAANRRARALT